MIILCLCIYFILLLLVGLGGSKKKGGGLGAFILVWMDILGSGGNLYSIYFRV